MSSRLLLVAVLLVLSACVSARFFNAHKDTCGPVYELSVAPTTSGLRDRYTGICYSMTGSDDCPRSWSSFEGIVLSRGPSDFIWRDFDPLFDVVHSRAPPGKATFWARAGVLVHRLSSINSNFVTLEDTFPAAGLDKNQFCPTASEAPVSASKSLAQNVVSASDNTASSQQASSMMRKAVSNTLLGTSSHERSWEYNKLCTQCAPSNITVSPTPLPPNTTFYQFSDAYGAWWQAASIRFGQEAVGTAHLVYEVEAEGPAFCPGEFFGSIELPSMNLSQVTGIQVLIATHPDNKEERCDSGSFVLLRTMIETKFAGSTNFEFTCADDPYDLTMVRCSGISQTDPYCEKLLSKFFPSTSPQSPPASQIPSVSAPNINNPATPTAAPSAVTHCLSKTTFKFLLLGVSIATFLAGILTTVVVQTIIGHYRRSKTATNQFPPSSSMKDVAYSSLLE